MNVYKSYNEYMAIIEKHQKQAPVQTIPIANEIGLKVYKTDEWDSNGTSGAIIKSKKLGGESGYACFVNNRHPVTRRRFTIAHEIAHFILHRDMIGDGIKDDALLRSGLSNHVEAQANALAADILMPWSLIRELMDQGKNTVPDLAEALNVSANAMSIRLNVPYEV